MANNRPPSRPPGPPPFGQRLDMEDDPGPVKRIGEVTTAVAIGRDTDKKEVPRILAAGRGSIAEQIVKLAFEHNIKVREDADLAEVLMALDIDDPIPLEAYVAVAEILSYVYRANASAKQRRAQQAPPSGREL